jgi:hypothetical protein
VRPHRTEGKEFHGEEAITGSDGRRPFGGNRCVAGRSRVPGDDRCLESRRCGRYAEDRATLDRTRMVLLQTSPSMASQATSRGGQRMTFTGHVGVGEASAGLGTLDNPECAQVHVALEPHGGVAARARPQEHRYPAGSPVCGCWRVALFK